MPVAGEVILRDRQEILQSMISEFQSLVPDVYVGLDGNLRMLLEVMAGVDETAFLAMQILSDDMFVTTANLTSLYRHGDQFGIYPKDGAASTGLLRFDGAGGTYLPEGTEAAYEGIPSSGKYFFVTTDDGTIPNPGIPTAPSSAVGAAGILSGSFEYGVTFVTPAGETELGATSTPLSVSSKEIDLSSVPLGGPGTIARNIYRRKDAISFLFVDSINDNVTTIYTDNKDESELGSLPPEGSTAEGVYLAATSEASGSRYNLAPGTITLLINAPDGVLSVVNDDYFIGGADPESIEVFRRRLLSALRNPGTGSKSDLKTWAEMHNGVEQATVFPNDNVGTPAVGHVTVRVSGAGGTIPNSDVIDAVQQDLDTRDFADIIIHVASFTPVSMNVTVDVEISDEFVLADLIPSIESAVAQYIESLEVGGTFYKSGVVDAVFGLVGILDVIVSSPSSNQTPAASEKFIPGTITVA